MFLKTNKKLNIAKKEHGSLSFPIHVNKWVTRWPMGARASVPRRAFAPLLTFPRTQPRAAFLSAAAEAERLDSDAKGVFPTFILPDLGHFLRTQVKGKLLPTFLGDGLFGISQWWTPFPASDAIRRGLRVGAYVNTYICIGCT